MLDRLHICGYCGSGDYNCPCRDRSDLRRMIGVALIVLGLCGALARAAFAQEIHPHQPLGAHRETSGSSPKAKEALAPDRDVDPGLRGEVKVNGAIGREERAVLAEPQGEIGVLIPEGARAAAAGIVARGKHAPVARVKSAAVEALQGVEADRSSGGHDGTAAAVNASTGRRSVPAQQSAPLPHAASETHDSPTSRSAAGEAPTLAVLLARTCANESTRVLRPLSDGGTDGAIDDDCRAMWQVVLGWADWQGTTPLRALRALAPHVTGARSPINPRHALYATLPARGSARPVLWDDRRHGPWSVYGVRWARFRDAVAQLVSGGAERVCPQPVVAWGCDADAHIAAARGLVEVDCGETQQHYYALPSSRALSAAEAGGRP